MSARNCHAMSRDRHAMSRDENAAPNDRNNSEIQHLRFLSRNVTDNLDINTHEREENTHHVHAFTYIGVLKCATRDVALQTRPENDRQRFNPPRPCIICQTLTRMEMAIITPRWIVHVVPLCCMHADHHAAMLDAEDAFDRQRTQGAR